MLHYGHPRILGNFGLASIKSSTPKSLYHTIKVCLTAMLPLYVYDLFFAVPNYVILGIYSITITIVVLHYLCWLISGVGYDCGKCCCNLVRAKCPSKNCRSVRYISNQLKNFSRMIIDTQSGQSGPLDRELREDEALLNSEGNPVSPQVYVPLGIYVASVLLLAFSLSIRNFIIEERDCTNDECFRYCKKNYDCFINYSHPMDICGEESEMISGVCFRLLISFNNGMMTFSNLIVMYYISLKAVSAIFQVCYRHTKVVKCLMLLINSISSISYYFYLSFRGPGYISSWFPFHLSRDDHDIFSFYYLGLLWAFFLPWEKIYTPQFKTSDGGGDDDGGPEIEDTRIHDGGVTSVQSGDEVEGSVRDYGSSSSHGDSLQGSAEDAPVMSSHEETV